MAGSAYRRLLRVATTRRSRKRNRTIRPVSCSIRISPPARSRGCLIALSGARAAAEAGTLAFGTIDCFLALASHRWKSTSDRRYQRRAHAIVRYRQGRMGQRTLPLFGVPRRLLPDVRDCSSVFGETTSRPLRCTDPHSGCRRRSASSDHRPVLFHARHDEIDLRHRLFCAAQHWF